MHDEPRDPRDEAAELRRPSRPQRRSPGRSSRGSPCRGSGTAAARRPSSRSAITLAACRPCWIATGRKPGRTSEDPSACRNAAPCPRAQALLGDPGARDPRAPDTTGAIDVQSGARRQHSSQRRGLDPAAQTAVRASIRCELPSARRIVTAGAVEIDDLVPEQRRDAEVLQRALRLGRQPGRECARGPVARFDEQDPGGARIERAEVAAQVARDLSDLTCHLNAGRPGADDHERQQRRARDRGRVRAPLPRTPRGSRAGSQARPRSSSAPPPPHATRRGRSSCTQTRRRRSACRRRPSRLGLVDHGLEADSRPSRSMSVTSPSRTRTFGRRRKIRRSG